MVNQKKHSNSSLKKEGSNKNSYEHKKNKTAKNSSTNLQNICVNCINNKISSINHKSSNKTSKPNSKPQSKPHSKPKNSSSCKSIKISTTNNYLLQNKINSLLSNSKKEIKKIKHDYLKYFSGANSPLKHNIIHSPSTLNSLSELPLNPSLSTLSSSNNDNNYYLSQSNKLSKFIKKYYNKRYTNSNKYSSKCH